MPSRVFAALATVVILAAGACDASGTGGTPPPGAGAKGRGAEGRPPDLAYYGLAVVDPQTAFVYGIREARSDSLILKTSDGGAHWTTVLHAAGQELVGMDFTDAANGAALSDTGVVYTTADGGQTWAVSTDAGHFVRNPVAAAPNGGSDPPEFSGIFFFGDTHGWAVGGRQQTLAGAQQARSFITRPVVVRTTDAGKTWSEVGFGAEVPAAPLTRVFFVDPRAGWAIGGERDDDTLNGILLKTTDGGATWTSIGTHVAQTPTDIFFADSTRGWLLGQTEDEATGAAGPSQILATKDGGATWQTQAELPASLYAVSFTDATNGWAVGDAAKIYHTTDGGTTWIEQESQDLATGQRPDVPGVEQAGDDLPVFLGFTLLAPGRGWASSDDGVYAYHRR